MDSMGNYIISEEIFFNWDNFCIVVINDYNNDGVGDLFFLLVEIYNGFFVVMQLNDFFIQYEIIGEYLNNIIVIKFFDFNNDGFDDVVFVDECILKVVDVNNQVMLVMYIMLQYFCDFDIVIMDGNVYVVFLIGDDLIQLFKLIVLGFFIQVSINIFCVCLVFINVDSDFIVELVCYKRSG